MSNNNLQQLMIVCQQMVQSGTPPSVALLRARAPFKVSVTEAIDAIKHFNAANGKNQSITNNEVPNDTIASLAKRVTQLEQRLAAIQKQLDEKT